MVAHRGATHLTSSARERAKMGSIPTLLTTSVILVTILIVVVTELCAVDRPPSSAHELIEQQRVTAEKGGSEDVFDSTLAALEDSNFNSSKFAEYFDYCKSNDDRMCNAIASRRPVIRDKSDDFATASVSWRENGCTITYKEATCSMITNTDEDDNSCTVLSIMAEMSEDGEAVLKERCGMSDRRLSAVAPHYWSPPVKAGTRSFCESTVVSLDPTLAPLKIHVHNHAGVRYIESSGGSSPNVNWKKLPCGNDNGVRNSRGNRPQATDFDYSNLELHLGRVGTAPFLMHVGGKNNALRATILVDRAYEFDSINKAVSGEAVCDYDESTPGIVMIELVPGCGLWLKQSLDTQA